MPSGDRRGCRGDSRRGRWPCPPAPARCGAASRSAVRHLRAAVLGGAVLLRPAVHLPGEGVAGLAVIREPGRIRVDGVEAGPGCRSSPRNAGGGRGNRGRAAPRPNAPCPPPPPSRRRPRRSRPRPRRGRRGAARGNPPRRGRRSPGTRARPHGPRAAASRRVCDAAHRLGPASQAGRSGSTAAPELHHGQRAGEALHMLGHPPGEAGLVDPVAGLDRLHPREVEGRAHAPALAWVWRANSSLRWSGCGPRPARPRGAACGYGRRHGRGRNPR